MSYLNALENTAIYIVREAFSRYKRPAMLWSIGKDSTTLLWMCRKAFFGEVPFPVIHIDTSYKFPEIYRVRNRVAKEWNLNLVIAQNKAALAQGMGPSLKTKFDCCAALKTEALREIIAANKYDAILLGIRRDEHGIRAKERCFSPRDNLFRWNYKDQPPELWDQYHARNRDDGHVRVHPLLHMTELDIWRYVRREGIPLPKLYFAKNGERYRSIGCETCCSPVKSNAGNLDEIIRELETTSVTERSGRAQDKEDVYTMQKLRAMGYM